MLRLIECIRTRRYLMARLTEARRAHHEAEAEAARWHDEWDNMADAYTKARAAQLASDMRADALSLLLSSYMESHLAERPPMDDTGPW